MRVLLDDRVWQPRHTDELLEVVRASRSDVAEEVEKSVAADYAAHRREQLALRRQQIEALHEVDALREAMKDTHAKVAALLETLIDYPLAKALVDGKLDLTLISDKDAKVALSAAEKILKITGAMAPPKIDVEVTGGSAFDLLDVVEAEEVEEDE